MNQSCSLTPYPSVAPNSPAHTLAFATIIWFPLYLLVNFFVYAYFRQQTLFLSKRSFRLFTLSCLTMIIPMSCSVIYDYVGSENFNCGLFVFLCYMSSPSFSFPLLLKVERFSNQLSITRLNRQLEAENLLVNPNEGDLHKIFGDKPLQGELSIRSFVGYLKFTMCHNRTNRVKVLHSKFAQTIGFILFWTFMCLISFFLAFVIRLSMNPHWVYCTGCNLEKIDSAIILSFSIMTLTLSVLANPKFIFGNISSLDSLRINQECYLSWYIGGFFLQSCLDLFHS